MEMHEDSFRQLQPSPGTQTSHVGFFGTDFLGGQSKRRFDSIHPSQKGKHRSTSPDADQLHICVPVLSCATSGTFLCRVRCKEKQLKSGGQIRLIQECQKEKA